jgi:diguanylate cyclase (GGDEF)-like protein/PAS domain S-box-containing protein
MIEQRTEQYMASLNGKEAAQAPGSDIFTLESGRYWHKIYDTMACGVLIWDTERHVIEANAAAQQILGMDIQSMQASPGRGVPGVVVRLDGTPLPTDEWVSSIIFRTGQPMCNQVIGYRNPDGSCRWIQCDGVPVYAENDTVTHVVVTFIDVTERVQAERRARESEARLQAILNHLPVILFVVDPTGIITLIEGKYHDESAETMANSVFDLYSNTDEALEYMRRALAGETLTVQTEIHGRVFEVRLVPLRNEQGEVTGILGVAIDITARKQAEEQLRYQSQHDALTDLPNRILLMERLEQAITASRPTGQSVALLMMDLDHFKEINDTFGHVHGDILLQQVAERLRQSAGETATVARLGGDEFALLLPVTDKAGTLQTVEKIHAALDTEFTIRGYPLRVEASIGIALSPEHGQDALTLLRRADMALYTAKRSHESYAFYDAANDQYSPRRLALIGALRKAITSNELILYYQPKADTRTGVVQGVEALLRWQHPIYGFLSPDLFIPLAEQTGLITLLSAWVLDTALKQCREWLRSGLELSISVNLSMWNLRDAGLPDTIASLLQAYCVPPRLLCIELTESAVMADTERTLDVLSRLSALGVQISVDDFGTGYSSLFYLKRLPVNELKIDKSFVQHMSDVEADAAIVRSTVEMAHSLGLHVVAEGVEDHTTLQLLRDLGCDTIQGYYMSRPLPPHDFERWLHETKLEAAT